MKIQAIADALSARLAGDGALDIERIVHPDDAERPSDLAVARTAQSAAALDRTKARAVVVSARRAPSSDRFQSVILIEQPRYALAILTALFDSGPARAAGVHPTAIVAPDATLGEGVDVGAYVVIGAGSRIGAGTAILPHVSVGANVVIGARGLIHAGGADRRSCGDRRSGDHQAQCVDRVGRLQLRARARPAP